MTELRATVRLQLQRAFDFDAAAAQVPYYAGLGVSHVYLSPIATARPGSVHGYDVIDPTRVNPELGGEDGLRRLVAALHARDMGAIVDIVPNHMAADAANPWWRDVLARGRQSSFARYVDIDWDAPQADGRVVLPILSADAGDHGCQLVCGGADPLALRCGGQALPLSAQSLRVVLKAGGAPVAALRSRGAALAACADRLAGRHAAALQTAIGEINATPQQLQQILDLQHYQLVDWRQANTRVNYRRFFDINDLVALATEQRQVFDAVHALPLRLVAAGLIDGLRIDHVDGLSRPGTYLRKLRRAVDLAAGGRPAGWHGRVTIHVEKILATGEHLPRNWPVDGSTGYDFMDEVGALLHDPDGERALQDAWAAVSGQLADFEHAERSARAGVLAHNLLPEWSRSARAWCAVEANTPPDDAAQTAMRGALGQVLQVLRVYRSYLADGANDAHGKPALAAAFAQAQARGGDAFGAQRMQLRAALLPAADAGPVAQPERLRLACQRFEQTAAALNAKAVEDTGFYRYGVLLSRNEVGSDPRRFALSPGGFHAAMAYRAAHWPQSLLATASHDHKRGEDTRARLAAVSGRADDFIAHATDWVAGLRDIDPQPAATDLWMLLQTVVAAWPLGLRADADGRFEPSVMRHFCDRIQAWQLKALREAKLRTSWLAPDADYEQACARVTTALFTSADCTPLRARVGAWAHGLDAAGALAGLAATCLRLTLPGVPDLYQGTEWWDQSLVDPDNRQDVDYAARAAALAHNASRAELLTTFRDGHIKQRVIRDLLRLRQEHPALLARGGYRALQVGAGAAPVLAFVREHDGEALLVVVPHLAGNGLAADDLPLAPTGCVARLAVTLEPGRAASWRDVFTGTWHRASKNTLALAPLLDHWPVAVLHAATVDR